MTLDDRINNICKLIKAQTKGDAGVMVHERRDGWKVTAVTGIPVAGNFIESAFAATTLEALANLEDKLCVNIDRKLAKLKEALVEVRHGA